MKDIDLIIQGKKIFFKYIGIGISTIFLCYLLIISLRWLFIKLYDANFFISIGNSISNYFLLVDNIFAIVVLSIISLGVFFVYNVRKINILTPRRKRELSYNNDDVDFFIKELWWFTVTTISVFIVGYLIPKAIHNIVTEPNSFANEVIGFNIFCIIIYFIFLFYYIISWFHDMTQ